MEAEYLARMMMRAIRSRSRSDVTEAFLNLGKDTPERAGIAYEILSKGVDMSKLVRVQRPVVRNGKTYLTHKWVLPSKVRKGDIVIQNRAAYEDWKKKNGQGGADEAPEDVNKVRNPMAKLKARKAAQKKAEPEEKPAQKKAASEEKPAQKKAEPKEKPAQKKPAPEKKAEAQAEPAEQPKPKKKLSQLLAEAKTPQEKYDLLKKYQGKLLTESEMRKIAGLEPEQDPELREFLDKNPKNDVGARLLTDVEKKKLLYMRLDDQKKAAEFVTSAVKELAKHGIVGDVALACIQDRLGAEMQQAERDDLVDLLNRDKTLTPKEKYDILKEKVQSFDRLSRKPDHKLAQEVGYDGVDVDVVEAPKIKGEHTSFDDLKAVNPNYSPLENAYSLNCQYCVCAYAARRRGYDVRAKGLAFIGKKPIIDAYYPEVFNGAVSEKLVSKGRTKKDIARSMRSNAEQKMKQWGDGAIAIVFGKWRGDPTGHVFIAEQRDGKTHFVDPQINGTDVSGNFEDMVRGMEIMRVDNCEFNVTVNKMFEKQGA